MPSPGKYRPKANLPRVAINLGSTISICLFRYFAQAFNSGGAGTRFSGGRHFTMLATNTSSRFISTDANKLSTNLPDAPTNGSHCPSYCKPGPSPMNITSMQFANGSGLIKIAEPPATIIGHEESRSALSNGILKYFNAITVFR